MCQMNKNDCHLDKCQGTFHPSSLQPITPPPTSPFSQQQSDKAFVSTLALSLARKLRNKCAQESPSLFDLETSIWTGSAGRRRAQSSYPSRKLARLIETNRCVTAVQASRKAKAKEERDLDKEDVIFCCQPHRSSFWCVNTNAAHYRHRYRADSARAS